MYSMHTDHVSLSQFPALQIKFSISIRKPFALIKKKIIDMGNEIGHGWSDGPDKCVCQVSGR